MRSPTPSAFLIPSRRTLSCLGTCLTLAHLAPALHAQDRPGPLRLDPEPTQPTTSYLDREIPLPAWASPDTPYTPAWTAPHHEPSPFLQPGLGTPAIGNPVLRPLDHHPNPSPIRYGPFDLWPRLSYQASYGDNLVRDQSTWLHTINPGFTLGAGDHWTIGYNPSVRIYSLDGFRDTVNQAVNLRGQTSYQNWGFRLNHATAMTDDPLVETAVQTDQTTHSSSIGATWDHGQSGTFDFSLSQNLRLSDLFPDLYAWSFQSWYDYPWRSATRLGAGLGFGYDNIDGGADMISERIHLRVSGPLTRKISYSVSGGVELRSFNGTDADMATSPLVAANLSYQLLERTSISGGFSHSVGNSYFANQITRNTSFQATVTQLLGQKWSLSGSGGYRFTSYEFTAGDRDVLREDNSTFASASVNWRPFPRFTSGLFYSYRSNGSDQGAFTFHSNQFGLRLIWSL